MESTKTIVAERVAEALLPTPQLTNKKSKVVRRKRIFLAVMLAYPLLQTFVFWFLVNLNSILLTFQEFSFVERGYVFVGLDNFKEVFDDLFNDDFTKRVILNSLLYMPVTNFVSLPCCILLSYFMYKKIPLGGAFKVIYFLPSIMPVVVLTMAFSLTFDADLGPVNDILRAIGITPPLSYFGIYPNNQIMIFIYCIWAGLGINTILLSGAISRIPEEIMEYNKIEGLGKAKELFLVAIPLIWPTISTLFILGCSSVFGVMMQPLLLTAGTTETYTIALYIYSGATGTNGPFLTAFGLTLSLIGLPIILLIRFICGKIMADVEY